jgi:hypothetical protein
MKFGFQSHFFNMKIMLMVSDQLFLKKLEKKKKISRINRIQKERNILTML